MFVQGDMFINMFIQANFKTTKHIYTGRHLILHF